MFQAEGTLCAELGRRETAQYIQGTPSRQSTRLQDVFVKRVLEVGGWGNGRLLEQYGL